jgi:hypothetical protein
MHTALPLTKNLTNLSGLPKQLCRDFHKSLSDCSFDYIKANIMDPYGELLKNSEDQGIITLMLRFGIKTNNEDIIRSVFDKLTMKRDFFDLMIHYNSVEYSTILFTKYINTDLIQSKDIHFMIENNLTYLLPFLDGKFIDLNIHNNNCESKNLRKYYLKNTSDYIYSISQDIINKDELGLFINYLKTIKYENIIDAGNVLHSRDGTLNIDDLKNVISITKNPLVVIYKRHLQNPLIKSMLNGVNYFASPLYESDDLFILIAYLHSNAHIITNDQYGDHTDKYKSNKKNESTDLRNYVMDSIINYTNDKGNITLNEYYTYSKCIQHNDKSVYIPTKDGFISIDI